MQTQLSGIFSALWIPTNSKGKVSWADLEQLAHGVLDRGCDGIMALGSTGNFPFFSVAERKEILRQVTGFAQSNNTNPGTSIIANISDVSLANVIELGEWAASLGLKHVAILPPWYYPIDQRDLARFFIEAGLALKLPLLLYNYPEVAGKKIELETIRRVADKTPVAGFKQSGGEFSYHEEVAKLAKEYGFSLLTGADTALPRAVKLGAAGSISGLSNAVPEVLASLWRQLKIGAEDCPEAKVMAGLGKFMSEIAFTHNVRAAIEARGWPTGEPVNPLSEESAGKYAELVRQIRQFYHENGIESGS